MEQGCQNKGVAVQNACSVDSTVRLRREGGCVSLLLLPYPFGSLLSLSLTPFGLLHPLSLTLLALYPSFYYPFGSLPFLSLTPLAPYYTFLLTLWPPTPSFS